MLSLLEPRRELIRRRPDRAYGQPLFVFHELFKTVGMMRRQIDSGDDSEYSP